MQLNHNTSKEENLEIIGERVEVSLPPPFPVVFTLMNKTYLWQIKVIARFLIQSVEITCKSLNVESLTNLTNISNFDGTNFLEKNPVTTYVMLNYY